MRIRKGARSAVRAALAGLIATCLLAIPAFAQHGEPPPGQAPAADPHATTEAHAPSIMQVDPGLMIWTVVTFVVLLVVLRFTAWKPLQAALVQREQRIQAAIDGAEAARRKSEAVLAEHEAHLQQARTEAHAILEEGKKDALRLQHEILAAARAEAEEFKARARREIELAADQAKQDLWEQSARISTELAEKILRRSLDAADHRRLVEQVLDEYRTVGSGGGSD